MSIRTLFVAIAMVAALVVAVQAVVLFTLFRSSESVVESMLATDLPAIQLLFRLEMAHLQIGDALEESSGTRDAGHPQPDRLKRSTETLSGLVRDATTLLNTKLEDSANVLGAQGKAILEQEQSLLRVLVPWLGDPSPLAGNGSGEPWRAGNFDTQRLLEQNERILAAVSEYRSGLESHIQRLRDRTRRSFDNAFHLTAAIPLVLMVIVILVGMAIRRQVVRPILQLNDAALRIAEGDLSVDLPKRQGSEGSGSNELHALRESMGLMVEALRERQHMEWLVRCSEKMSSIGRLAIGIAHEVNNPLANASVNLQLLEMQMQKQPEAALCMDRVRLIRRNVDNAIRISQELLHFSKSDKDDFAPVNLKDPIENAIMLQEYAMKNFQIRKQWLHDAVVQGLGNKLEQVFVNLFRNAADAMPDGGEIQITVTRRAGLAVVTVQDNGPGIPETILGKVFEPFVTTKGKDDGFGLGLAVCQSIVDQHDGTIEISSLEGQGVTVTLTFPVLE